MEEIGILSYFLLYLSSFENLLSNETSMQDLTAQQCRKSFTALGLTMLGTDLPSAVAGSIPLQAARFTIVQSNPKWILQPLTTFLPVLYEKHEVPDWLHGKIQVQCIT